MRTVRILIGIVLVGFLQPSCNFKPDEITLPQWKSEWLGPLARISLSPQDIQGIDSIVFQHDFSISDLGVPSGNLPSLPVLQDINLSATVTTSDIYYEVTFDSAFTTFQIQNQTPFTIQAGAYVAIEKNGDTLFRLTIPNPITPNSTYTSPEIDFAGKKLYHQVNVHLRNLSTNAINQPVTITGNERIGILFTIRNLQLRELAVESNNHFEVIDTTDFSFGGGDVNTQAVNGKLKLFIENQFPIKQTMQAYFMDSLYQVLDSLFSSPFVITPADVDGQGYSINKPLSSAEIVLDPQKFERLKNTRYLKATASFDNIHTAVPLTRMRRTDKFDIQVVGDLKLQSNLTQK